MNREGAPSPSPPGSSQRSSPEYEPPEPVPTAQVDTTYGQTGTAVPNEANQSTPPREEIIPEANVENGPGLSVSQPVTLQQQMYAATLGWEQANIPSQETPNQVAFGSAQQVHQPQSQPIAEVAVSDITDGHIENGDGDIDMIDADPLETEPASSSHFNSQPVTDEQLLEVTYRLESLTIEEFSDRWMEGSTSVVAALGRSPECDAMVCASRTQSFEWYANYLTIQIAEQVLASINHLLVYATYVPHLWKALVAAYFNDPGKTPCEILGRDMAAGNTISGRWEWDLVRQDLQNKWRQQQLPFFSMPSGEEEFLLQSLANYILDEREDLFIVAINRWQHELMAHDPSALQRILQPAGWCCDVQCRPEWQMIASVKRMEPCPQRQTTLEQAYMELPLFTERCLVDPACC